MQNSDRTAVWHSSVSYRQEFAKHAHWPRYTGSGNVSRHTRVVRWWWAERQRNLSISLGSYRMHGNLSQCGYRKRLCRCLACTVHNLHLTIIKLTSYVAFTTTTFVLDIPTGIVCTRKTTLMLPRWHSAQSCNVEYGELQGTICSWAKPFTQN